MSAHETLDGVHGIFRVYHRLTFGGNANQTLAVFIKCNYRG